MEKKQADAIAQAILEPRIHAQEEIQRKRAVETARLARKRRVALYVLAGFGIGAAIAYFSGVRFALGGIWGGLVGSAVGWLTTRRAT